MSLPAALGLTTTQASSVWGSNQFDVNSLNIGSYADDAVGSIMNSVDSAGHFVSFTCPNVSPVAAGTYYVTTSLAGMTTVRFDTSGGFVYATELGSITTAIGTEYIYAVTIGAVNIVEVQVNDGGATPYYARFWDGDPALYSPNTAPGVIINSITLRS